MKTSLLVSIYIIRTFDEDAVPKLLYGIERGGQGAGGDISAILWCHLLLIFHHLRVCDSQSPRNQVIRPLKQIWSNNERAVETTSNHVGALRNPLHVFVPSLERRFT